MISYLEQVPFDIAFYIASHLHLEDAVHLAQTCRRLYGVLDEPALYRSIVEKYPYSEEASLARSGQITFREALKSIYDRRNALANANPFSVRVLGSANMFLSRKGKICMLKGTTIHVSEIRSSRELVQFDLSLLINPALDLATCQSPATRISLLFYNDDIVSILLESEDRINTGHILAISTAAQVNRQRVLAIIPLEATSKLFVRHTAGYLYYGTHTGIGSDDHHKWEIFGMSFNQKKYPIARMERPLLLENFHGSDIGSTVAFEIHNNDFYAVSNQGTYEVEEVDWTSFYHCVRLPLDKPVRDAVEKNERVYRRQHVQGPIHDSWTDLSLQVSEESNQVMIVESRREWEQASSRQSRTFYVSAFDADASKLSQSSDGNGETVMPMLPEGDIYIGTLDCTSKPNYMPTPDLYSWSQHPELPKDARPTRPFPLSKTKFRAYNYSCSTFLDLVEDDRCCNDPSKPPCLRIRVGSRRETEPSRAPDELKSKQRLDNHQISFEDSHTRYYQSPIRLWPPPASPCACSKRMHDIMNPPLPSGSHSHTRTITGVLDERSFVYMVKQGRSYGAGCDSTLGTIVVVDFTRPSTTAKCASSSPTTNPLPAPAPIMRKDSVLDSTSSPQEHNDKDKYSWTWSPGHRARCRAGTCQ